jgi:hypothetical protein
LPTEINFRANIYALKILGVDRIISVSAVGSLKEELAPGEFLVADQFVDRTRNRISTFFGDGLVAHVTFDKPTCPQVSRVLADASVHCGVKVHRKGIYICMEGPQFSTLAEAHTHRALNFDVIGTRPTSPKPSWREAELCYGTIAMITDYDCWHPDHESVTGTQNQRDDESKCRKRSACAPRGSQGFASGARMQVRQRAGACADHRSQTRVQIHQEAPRGHHRKIHFIMAFITRLLLPFVQRRLHCRFSS